MLAAVACGTASAAKSFRHLHIHKELVDGGARSGRFTIVTSDYLSLELIRNPDPAKRADTLAMTGYAGLHVALSETLARRAEEIEVLGITGYDALHIAAAEASGCDYLVTTDDGLLKKSKRLSSQLTVSVLNPIDIVSLA